MTGGELSSHLICGHFSRAQLYANKFQSEININKQKIT